MSERDLGIYGRIILKQILKKWHGREDCSGQGCVGLL
jgi:hypothetical protein